MNVFDDPASRTYARVAGGLYLTIAIAGGFSIAYVPSVLQVPGDLPASVERMLANRSLFLAGIGGDTVMMVAELLVTPMLYFMFRQTNATISLAAAFARLTMVTVMAAMLLLHAAMLAVADNALTAFSATQRFQIAGALLQAHDAGVWVWQIFFTLHLWLLGWLVLQSRAFPRLLGLGLIIGGSGYLADSIYAFAAPSLHWLGWIRAGLLGIVTVSELGFALWLLVRGTKSGIGTQLRPEVAAEPSAI